MYIKQLTVFIENKTGRLGEVLNMLKANDINIVSLSLADTADYGLLRLIVSDPKTAKEALTQNGFSAMLTDVVAVRLSHKVGKLQELLAVICEASINIEYMYALATGSDDASIVMKTSNVEKVTELLEAEGVEAVTFEDILKWSNGITEN